MYLLILIYKQMHPYLFMIVIVVIALSHCCTISAVCCPISIHDVAMLPSLNIYSTCFDACQDHSLITTYMYYIDVISHHYYVISSLVIVIDAILVSIIVIIIIIIIIIPTTSYYYSYHHYCLFHQRFQVLHWWTYPRKPRFDRDARG